MISLHKLNADEIMVNCDHIEFIEETPDTVISMTTGRKLVVSESSDKIRTLILNYKRQLYCPDIKKTK